MESPRTLGLKKEALSELTSAELREVVGGATMSVVQEVCTAVSEAAGTDICQRPSCCSCTAVSDTVER